jgi:hypothetical protein
MTLLWLVVVLCLILLLSVLLLLLSLLLIMPIVVLVALAWDQLWGQTDAPSAEAYSVAVVQYASKYGRVGRKWVWGGVDVDGRLAKTRN